MTAEAPPRPLPLGAAVGVLVAATLVVGLWRVDYWQLGPPERRANAHAGDAGFVIAPGHEAEVLALFADAPRAGPWRLHAVRIERDHVVADFADAAGAVGGSLVLRRGSRGSAHFDFERAVTRDDPALGAALDAAERSVQARDKEELFDAAANPRSAPTAPGPLAALALVAWAGLLLARDRFRPKLPAPVLRVRRTHVLPAVLQALVFAYWGLYYDEVWHHLPVLGVLVCFAFAFDVLMAWTLRRAPQLGVAVVPVVLSANLFVWFSAESAWAYFAVVGVALGSRALRRGGTHVFNPSAVAVALYGALALVLPARFPYVDIANALNLPPNQAELIFVLALLPHLLLDTVVVSLGAAAALLALYPALGHTVPSPVWPGWLLSITLLAGDPATMPKTSGGRALFGLAFGAGVGLTASALTHLGQMDYFAKVLPLPLMNGLAPRFDAWAKRLPAAPRPAAPLPAAAWAVVFVLALSAAKRGGFEPVSQRTNQTRFLVLRGGTASCDDNPLFCRPFTVSHEVSCWRDPPACLAPR